MGPSVSLSDDTFRTIFESAVQGIIAVDSSGRIELANPSAERLFGYLDGELEGKPLEVLIPQRSRGAHEQYVAAYSAAPSQRPMGIGKELAGFRKDGTEFPVEVSLSFSPDASLAFAFITDIAQRKHQERERDGFFVLSPDLLCIATPEGIFREVNPAFLRILGYTKDEIVGRHYAELLHPDDRAGGEDALKGVLDGIPVDGSFRSRHLAKDGSIRWLEWTARALWSDEVLVYSAARDITATVELNETRRLTEERLRSLTGQLLNAQEEERRRIARELHDSTTQELALVSAELAQLEKKAGPEQRADFVALRERLVAISEQVRVLAHDFHPGVLEHLGLTAALQAHCREVSQHSGIRVHFRPGPEVGKVPTSIATSLYRITQEALRNVAKHSGAVTATVMLSRLEPTPGKRVLRLAVIDDGKGFVMEKALNGSGLGLVSIEERARLVDGEMSIHSIPGEGTRVEVEVPLPTEEPSEE